MKKSVKDECGFICWAIGVLFLLIVFLILVNDSDIAKFTEKRPGMASWVQAFGSITTIIFSGIFVWWQVRENKRISDLQQNDLKNKKINNVKCVLEDEKDYVERAIKGYDLIFEHRYDVIGGGFNCGFFKPRPLSPILINEILSEYYSEYSKNERLGLKSVLTIYPALNNYADMNEEFNRRNKSQYNGDIYQKEISMAVNYVKSGLIYYHTLQCLIEGAESPRDATKDRDIIKNIHEILQLKININQLI